MLIHNGKLITWQKPNTIVEGNALLVRGGKIEAIGPEEDLRARYPLEERLDAHSQYIMPGNICAHTHFYGAFSRGLYIPGRPAKDFPEILDKLWWPLDRALTLEDVRYSALVCLVDAVRHGTTTLIDHHASPNAIDGSLDVIAEAVEEAGVRAGLCYEVTDRNGLDQAEMGIRENVRLLNLLKHEPQRRGRLAGLFGMHASLTLSEETLDRCRAAVGDEVGFHIHVAEHSVDEYDSLEKCNQRVIDRLLRHGILGPNSIIVHAVHIDAREIELLAETNTWVSHQPRSNMNNAVGLPAVESMLRSGIRVCLGNDGFSNAMWEEWKAAYLAHKLVHQDPRRMSANTVVEMAIYNNAALASTLFTDTPVGVIQTGAVADLIFVDFHPFTPLTVDNLPWQMVFGFHESMITTTMVAGNILMRDRQLVTLDEEKIAFEAQKLAPDIWERYWKQFKN